MRPWSAPTGAVTLDPSLSLANYGMAYVRDEFNATSYSNNDGTAKWTTDWQETGDSYGAGGGNITIEVDYCPDRYSRCIEFDARAWSYPSIERELDLSGTSSVTLTFDYRLDDYGAAYALEVSPDGGVSWVTLDSFSGYELNSGSFDLTPYLAANTRIRFRQADRDYDANLYIDNVQVTYQFGTENTYLATTGV